MSGQKSVMIIGGGASGLMAAIFAAKEGAAVTVLEHSQSFGKKLLATGNGRCNLTNVQIYGDSYRGSHREFAAKVLERYDNRQTIAFFSKLGIYTMNQEGRLYPHSQQASSVLDVLMMEARHRKVKLKTCEEVKVIAKEGDSFRILTENWTYHADRVILCTGSPASNISGADDSGYQLARMLGHQVIKPLPALVPLRCKGKWFSSWAGVRVDAKVTLLIDKERKAQERGEVQMTNYGVSGIPIFQLSSYAVRALDEGRQAELLLDFLPEFEERNLRAFLQMRKEQCPYKNEKELLCGLFPDKLIPILLKSGFPQSIKELRLQIQSAHSMTNAQVCSGGVDVTQVQSRTLESSLCPGLYFAGEILDIDGACGGYNLQWAWSTGAIAGSSAGREKG